jgi:predicted GIY-YIG superfamily endonuclease
MYYVYLLKSESHPKQPYVGSTRNLRQRLKDHNEGRCLHTAKFRPWILVAYFAFAQEKTAIAFESSSSRVQDGHSSTGTFYSESVHFAWSVAQSQGWSECAIALAEADRPNGARIYRAFL